MENNITNSGDIAGKVVDQTKELIDRISELEALNKTMVGRELKMVELKKENEKLKELLNLGKNNPA